MIDLLAIDPGIRGCGVALFQDGRLAHVDAEARLAWAAYVPNTVARGDDMVAILSMARAVRDAVARRVSGLVVDVLVVEFPQVYAGGKAKGDPRDLLTLAAIDGAIGVEIPARRRVLRYFPREWKGQTDADLMLERILERLDALEVDQIAPCRASLRHNAIDAVGIGLKALGRLEPRKVISRGGDWKHAR